MTDQELTDRLNKAMGHCPGCGSDDLSMRDVDGDKELCCKWDCEQCGASWREYYRFESASGFTPGD